MTLLKIESLIHDYIEPTQLFLSEQLNHFFRYEYDLKNNKDDVFLLENKYIIPERSNLWVALDHQNSVIGSIAVSAYDNRIDVLTDRYDINITSEICRCYVHPEHRRKGIGSHLLMLAERFCVEKMFSTIYLHTHHFLPGGYDFWKKNNYSTTFDMGSAQQIIHMEKTL